MLYDSLITYSPSESNFLSFRRYVTVLYFLNRVEEGGETAFPVADEEYFNETVTIFGVGYLQVFIYSVKTKGNHRLSKLGDKT